MIGIIAGILILVVAIYVLSKIVKQLLIGAALIIAIFLATSLIFKETPYLPWDKIPVIGNYLQEKFSFPKNFSEAIVKVRNVFYNVEIIDVEKLSNGNVALVILNSGKLDQNGNITLYFDGSKVDIVKMPSKLESGHAYIIETSSTSIPTNISLITEKNEVNFRVE